MILEDIDKLIQEVEEFSTIERTFRYGPLKTFALFVWRTFNMEILNYFDPLLEKIDNAIDYFDTTKFKASKYINKVDLGEVINISKMQSDDIDNLDRMDLFRAIFININKLIINLIKAYIDELSANNIQYNGVTSINSLLAVKYNSKSTEIISEIFDIYSNLLTKKPTSSVNILSELKRRYLDSKFISEIMLDLDNNITQYIAKKQETSSNSQIIRNSSL